jgi:hypothetical protein
MGSTKTPVTFPMAAWHRLMLEGSLEQSEAVLSVCQRHLAGETAIVLKDGVDPLELLIEAAKSCGRITTFLKLDDEAWELADAHVAETYGVGWPE